ncbi:MAG: Gfo/Idh/MocA family protein [Planctomycetota bacterium]|jgi:predicted dehydrogenase
MEIRKIGIIMNGVTGRMGTNQHLIRSILAIRDQGGIKVNDDLTIMPDPILTGRNENKLKDLAEKHNVEKFTTDIQSALDDDYNEIFFDASGTNYRKKFVEMAVKAGKSIYCEKPTATSTAGALELAKLCENAKLKNGVVQDKLWLPGFRKLKKLIDTGFFGKIISVKADFGYWVFEGDTYDQPIQRPSWNYRKEDGGGMIIDMLCHYRYVIDNIFGNCKSVCCLGKTLIDKRVDEAGNEYDATADDAAFAIIELEDGTPVQVFSSWCTRVRRDDLFTVQVDGTKGSAVAGLRRCWCQHSGTTPKPVWNPDIDNPIDFYEGWEEVPETCEYDNAFKIQWELFIRHVVLDEPFRWTLMEGAKGVQLAEASLQSSDERRWIDLTELK